MNNMPLPLFAPSSMGESLAEPVNVVHDNAMDRWVNKVHCGDCVALLEKMPPSSVGAVVTSPHTILGTAQAME